VTGPRPRAAQSLAVNARPTVREVPVERLTEGRFRPFGQVVGARRTAPSYRSGGGAVGWVLDFESDGRTRLSVSRTPFRELTFRTLERHLHVTQAFIALAGAPAVLAVAAPPPDDGERPPEPDAVHGFLLETGQGVLLARGTWHTPARYPLRAPGTVFAVLSDHETAADPARSEEIDYHARYGLTFRLGPSIATRRRPARREAGGRLGALP
jgi:ureidoglycolate lyase